VHVNVKDLGRIQVVFGNIRIPKHLVKGDVGEVEKKYNCFIRWQGVFAEVRPNPVKEYGFLSTDDKDQMDRLRTWFEEYSDWVAAELMG